MANHETIPEQVLTPDEMTTLEVGGARRLDIASITTLSNYTITNITAVKTEWGTRIDFTIQDNWGEAILSDWNIQMKRKVKVLELKGKKITLEPSKSAKKVIMNVLE